MTNARTRTNPPARASKVKVGTLAEALKAYNASTNAQRAADAIRMTGRTFRNIARDLGFGPQKYGTSWDAKSRAALLKDERVQRHIERVFGKRPAKARAARTVKVAKVEPNTNAEA